MSGRGEAANGKALTLSLSFSFSPLALGEASSFVMSSPITIPIWQELKPPANSPMSELELAH